LLEVARACARKAQQQLNTVSIELVSSLNGAFCRIVLRAGAV
jgi:hypothetical protein